MKAKLEFICEHDTSFRSINRFILDNKELVESRIPEDSRVKIVSKKQPGTESGSVRVKNIFVELCKRDGVDDKIYYPPAISFYLESYPNHCGLDALNMFTVRSTTTQGYSSIADPEKMSQYNEWLRGKVRVAFDLARLLSANSYGTAIMYSANSGDLTYHQKYMETDREAFFRSLGWERLKTYPNKGTKIELWFYENVFIEFPKQNP